MLKSIFVLFAEDPILVVRFFLITSSRKYENSLFRYPSLGTRFMHTSEGHLLINRLVPCPDCINASSCRKMSLNGNIGKKGLER